MFKNKKWLGIFAFLAATALVTSSYQNCANQRDWTVDVMRYDVASSTDIQEHQDRDHGNEEREAVLTSYKPILGDRLFVSELLADIFYNGNVTASSAVIARVARKGPEFGGTCLLYEDYRVKSVNSAGVETETSGDPRHVCTLADSTLNAPENSNSHVSRHAWLDSVCEAVVMSNATMDAALKKIAAGAPGVIPPPTEENMLKLFYLFYRGKPAPQPGLLQSLQFLFPDPAAPTKDHWRVAFYTVCSSSHWQVQ